jgi:hypothetical protein
MALRGTGSFYRTFSRTPCGQGFSRLLAGRCLPALAAGRGFAGVEHVLEVVCRLARHTRDPMLVGGHRETGVRMAEPFRDDFDRCAGRDEKAGMGVSEVVKSDARHIGANDVAIESWVTDSGWMALPSVFVKIGSSSPVGCPWRCWRRFHRARTLLVVLSRSTDRRDVFVLHGTSIDRPPTTWRERAIETRWVACCQSPHRRPATSPRRIPVVAAI